MINPIIGTDERFYSDLHGAWLTLKTDMVRERITNLIPSITANFDERYREDFAAMDSALSRVLFLSMKVREAQFKKILTEPEQESTLLILNGSHVLMTAIELVRTGSWLQPGILVRYVVECICYATYLIQHTDEIKLYYKRKLPLKPVMKAVEPTILNVCTFHGKLSQMLSHHNASHRLAGLPLRHETDDMNVIAIMTLIRKTIVMLEVAQEMVMFRMISSPRYWRAEGTTLIYAPSTETLERVNVFIRGHKALPSEPEAGSAA